LKAKTLGILFTSLYIVAMLQPIAPVISYYINYDYIVEELCENKAKPVLQCNGKCHLTKELKKANDGLDTEQPAPPLNMKEYPVVPTLIHYSTFESYQFIKIKHHFEAITENLNSNYINFIFHPPKFSC